MLKIAITQRIQRNKYGKETDSLEHDYINYYAGFGVILVPVPNTLKDVSGYLKDIGIRGIILSGGGDIHPALYGGTPKSGCEYFSERENLEKKLLKFAVKNDIPVLGECRGMQFLNAFFGGSLLDGVSGRNGVPHAGARHKITIIDTRAEKYLGVRSVMVNSFHNQGFSKKELSGSLKVFAEAADGMVEGVYYPGKAIAGIMWHPERGKTENLFNTRLVESFIKRKLYWSKR